MNKLKYFIGIAFLSLYCAISLTSCVKEDKFNTDSSFRLAFSNDTITFDTIFTTTSSAFRELRVYNDGNDPIKISSIFIPQGDQSRYRITVDGIMGNSVSDVEILPKDSISIFVRVNINPNDKTTPFIVSDSIMFNINGSTQKVMLSAYGRNAYYHVPDYNSNRYFVYLDDKMRERRIYYSLADEGGAKSGVEISGGTIKWKTDKPHVVVDYCVVDSTQILELASGTDIYLSSKGRLWVYNSGTLKVSGTTNSPVTFQGTRLESFYQDVPGQWEGIWLSVGSKDNEIDNAIIRNSNIGLLIDSCVNANPTLKLSNTIIKNAHMYGILAQGAAVDAENVVVSNCGQSAVALTIGGRYNFRHSTIGNYWNGGTRVTPSVILNNWYEDRDGNIHVRNLDQAYFGNCIIYGNIENELSLSGRTEGNFIYSFRNCLIKSSQSFNISGFTDCEALRNKDPKFVDTKHNDLRLQTGSPAVGQGNSDDGLLVPYDIKGFARSFNPTLGAYEQTVEP